MKIAYNIIFLLAMKIMQKSNNKFEYPYFDENGIQIGTSLDDGSIYNIPQYKTLRNHEKNLINRRTIELLSMSNQLFVIENNSLHINNNINYKILIRFIRNCIPMDHPNANDINKLYKILKNIVNHNAITEKNSIDYVNILITYG